MEPLSSVRLIDLATVIRSKNAGPLQTTMDLMFATLEDYRLAAASPSLSVHAIAKRYAIDESWVQVIPFEAARAIKIVLDRPTPAGQPGDCDVYGAQQHYPLLEITL